MPDIRFFNNCDHQITSTQIVQDTAAVTRTAGAHDIVHLNRHIQSIIEVKRPPTFLSSWLYYDTKVIPSINYGMYGQNGITWHNLTAVPTGYQYLVDYIYHAQTSETYSLETCPRCGSNGWYVDLIDNSDYSIYVASGGRRIAQEFLKMLLTERGTDRLDPLYGTGLAAAVVGLPLSKGDELITFVTGKVAETVSAYKDRQARDSRLPDDERLLRADINSIEIDQANTSIFVSIRLVSFGGTAVTANIRV